MKLLRIAAALLSLLLVGQVLPAQEPQPQRLATFDIDVTPPVGYMMAYDKVLRRDDLPLRLRGVVLLGAGQPIVLCAVDWIGIANEGHDAFRAALAEAAGTTPDRVAVHTLHQHDAPECDFTAERLLKAAGVEPYQFDSGFSREIIARAADAVHAAIGNPQSVTHVGWGEAEVKEVASNRRIMGPDAKVIAVRYTATKDPALRAEPEGVIDPRVCLISFWIEDKPLAVLSYYACHPQSYYRTGIPNPDFPGIARFIRGQAVPEALHVHFNGAGGNIGAGKYNDGAKENRVALAMRLADGMRRAWEATKKSPIAAATVQWKTLPVALPVAPHLDEAVLRATMTGPPPTATTPNPRASAADQLAWLMRCREGHKISLALLSLGDIRVLHMPGELFVEYQLAAQKMRPDLHVAMAAYGDYGPGYIGTERAYAEGGYETAPRSSSVAPAVEKVLMDGMQTLLQGD